MPTIHVVGLGPGDFSTLPMGTYQQLTRGLPNFLRTGIHPAVERLAEQGVHYETFDNFYETGEDFEQIYDQMASTLLAQANRVGELVYAVPGHPLMAERSVQKLLESAVDVDIVIGPGQSFLDPMYAVLEIDPVEGFLLLDGTSMHSAQLNPAVHTFIAQVFHPSVASDVKLTLMELYDDDYVVTVVRAAGVIGEERVETMPLYELDRLSWIDHLTSVYIPPGHDTPANRKDPWFTAGLVQALRAPDGCPWDKEQTHASLRPYVLEESYEVAYAIDEGDPVSLADELGDLYLQILLHAQIASEAGEFTIRDVYQALSDKLIRRHPHVFGQDKTTSASEAQAIWGKAKAAEMGDARADSHDSIFTGMKRAQSPWALALDMQARAAKIGFDWPDIRGVLDKVKEEVSEVEQEIHEGAHERLFDELGDLVFSVINLARHGNIDLELALQKANLKFRERFERMESYARENDINLGEISINEYEKYWNYAKIQGKYRNHPHS